MKHFILLLSALFLLGQCDQDDSGGIPDDPNEIHWDADNLAAPDLPAGIHETAARFEDRDMSAYANRELSSVKFHLTEVPDNLVVKIYGKGRSNNPGDLLLEESITGAKSNSWNTYQLQQPLSLSGDEIWISLRFELSETGQVTGCDPGPAFPNGDWSYNSVDNDWQYLRERTSGTVNINWNLRGVLTPE